MRWVPSVGRVVALGLCAAAVPAAYAQEDEGEQDTRVRECECRYAPGAFHGWQSLGELPWMLERRARLGVVLDREADAETEAIGARIERVVPGSPAERAGLSAGDIIVSLDGERLAEGAGEPDGEETPARRLSERIRDLEPGTSVELEYRRGDETRTATVELEEMGAPELLAVPEGRRPMVRMHRMLDRLDGVRDLAESFGSRAFLGGLDLAELNEGLARYFGTDRGVLVLEVPEESELNLQAGDVIRTIDGREVEGPSDVRRILRSYVPEEEISFEIVRDRSEMSIRGHVPESWSAGGELRLERRRRR